MGRFLLICSGGALGTGARFLVSGWAALAVGSAFPRATLLVNVTGSFVIALVMELSLVTGAVSQDARLFLTTGLMGGYTTYSSFNHETLALAGRGAWDLALLYVALTVVGALAAGFLGLFAARAIASAGTRIDDPERDARRRAIRQVVLAAIGTRALVAACLWAGTFFPRENRGFDRIAADGHRYMFAPWRLLDALARWDSAFYLRLAGQGYVAPASGAPYDAAFFPLYPAIVRGAAWLTGLPLVAAGALVSLACFALAVRAVFLLLEEVAGPGRAGAATVALLVFPASLFLTAVYPESLFLLLSATAIRAARRGGFALAGLAAALAALTRPNGALVLVPVAIEAAAALRRRERLLPDALALALPCAAVLLHMAELRQAFGDPLAFIHVQAQWSRGLAPPWAALLAFNFDPEYYVVALGALAAIAWAVRRQPASLQAHAALAILVPLCTGTMKSLPRFAGVAFPLFLTVSDWTAGRRRRAAYLAVALALLAVYAFRFARGDAIN